MAAVANGQGWVLGRRRSERSGGWGIMDHMALIDACKDVVLWEVTGSDLHFTGTAPC